MKQLMRNIKIAIINLKIRRKLMLSFMLLIIIPIVIIAIISTTISIEIIKIKTDRYSHDMLFQITKTFETRLEKIEDISFNIVFNQEVQDMLFKAQNGRLSQYDASLIRRSIESILASQVLYHNEIYAIYVISTGGYVYQLNKTKQDYGLMEEQLESIYAEKGGTVWFGGQNNSKVTALTRIINSKITQKPIGYLVIYVEEDFLYELIANNYSIEGGKIYIIDAYNKIVSTDDKTQIGESMPIAHENLSDNYSFATYNIDGKLQYMATSKFMNNGWKIVSCVPVAIYNKEIYILRVYILILTLVILIVANVLAWGISLTISRPIRKLTDVVEEYGKSDLSLRAQVSSKDEIGELAITFNKMAQNIDELVVKVYEERLMKQDAELKSLRMQINPHFFYNTLDTINWMARVQGIDDIGIVAKSLGDLMRSTINDRDYVTIIEEIASLNNYILIQKYRYKDRFDMAIDIAPETENFYVPKMVIQPLVENALHHGIEPSFEKGIISVQTRLSDSNLVIKVTDSGSGISAETIEKIIISTNSADYLSDSIGLRNVIKRINTLFHNKNDYEKNHGYGVDIHSEIGKGTSIAINMPVIKELPWKATV